MTLEQPPVGERPHFWPETDQRLSNIRKAVYERAWDIARAEQADKEPSGPFTQSDTHLWQAWDELMNDPSQVVSILSKQA
jgi:hypothetical protein